MQKKEEEDDVYDDEEVERPLGRPFSARQGPGQRGTVGHLSHKMKQQVV
jgi:hypothetical protein